MASKTPISILQEYCVSKNLPVPRYDFENRTQVSSPSVFACYCFCDGRKLEAVSSSKKDAKQRVAEMMLNELKVPTFGNLPPLKHGGGTTTTTTTSDAVNYIGLLNEYCAGHGLPYPEYGENGFQNGYFFCTCRHGSLKADGAGKTKKEAKRCAAQNMLEEINKNGLGEIKKSTPATARPNYDVDQVINRYKNLSINPSIKKSDTAFKDLMTNPATAISKHFAPKLSHPRKLSPVDDLPKQHISNVPLDSHASLTELESKLKGRGIKYEVEKTQDAPIVLIYSELSTSNVSLEIGRPGDAYETVLRALLGKIVQQYELLES